MRTAISHPIVLSSLRILSPGEGSAVVVLRRKRPFPPSLPFSSTKNLPFGLPKKVPSPPPLLFFSFFFSCFLASPKSYMVRCSARSSISDETAQSRGEGLFSHEGDQTAIQVRQLRLHRQLRRSCGGLLMVPIWGLLHALLLLQRLLLGTSVYKRIHCSLCFPSVMRCSTEFATVDVLVACIRPPTYFLRNATDVAQ